MKGEVTETSGHFRHIPGETLADRDFRNLMSWNLLAYPMLSSSSAFTNGCVLHLARLWQ